MVVNEEITRMIGVKHGYPLSPTLFGLYIDGLESTIKTLRGTSCSLAEATIPIIQYDDDVVLLLCSTVGL